MRLKTKRRLVQVLSFLIANLGLIQNLKTGLVCPFLYCHGCPFAILGCPIGLLQNFIAWRRLPLLTIGSLGVYGTLAGRAFCGWLCPFGALHDLLSRGRGGPSKPLHHAAGYIRYVVLIAAVLTAWVTLDPAFCRLCPSGSLFGAIPFHILHLGSVRLGPAFYVHLLTLLATLLLALAVSRFWCRYLCPLGAIYGPFNRISLIGIRLDPEKCVGCMACLRACPMGVSRLEGIGRSANCILCGRCVEACPEGALSFRTG